MEEKSPVFEIQFTPKLAMYREYVWKMTSPLVYLFLLAVEIFLVHLLDDLYQEDALWEHPFVWIAAVYMLLWPLVRQELSARNNLTRMKKVCGGTIPEINISFGDTIEVREGKNHYSAFQYEQIIKLVRLKHSYVMMLDKKIGLLFDPNGFTVGNAQQLPDFLLEKNPNIRIKK